MNPADINQRSLPRYGLSDDDKTRPCVVLFDWHDDEATVRVSPLELAAATAPPPPADSEPLEEIDVEELEEIDEIDVVEELDDLEMQKLFRPRWPGVGRRPGAVALAVVLGCSFAIGAFALFGSGSAQAQAADASASTAGLLLRR